MTSSPTLRLPAPVPPTPRPKALNWLALHEKYKALAQQGGIDVLLLGDSLTLAWDSAPAAWQKLTTAHRIGNFGIGSDTSENVLWRLQDIAPGPLNPRVISLLIGVNDLAIPNNQTPEVAAAGVHAILTHLRSRWPAARLLLWALLPIREPVRDLPQGIAVIHQTNALLRSVAAQTGATFIDVSAPLLAAERDAEPALDKDNIHLTPRGYQILTDTLLAAMQNPR